MTNLLNISIVVAWKFYFVLHQNDAKITHLEFRKNISLVLTKSSTIRNQSQGGRHADLPSEVRYDGQDHNSSTLRSRQMCGVSKEHQVKVQ